MATNIQDWNYDSKDLIADAQKMIDADLTTALAYSGTNVEYVGLAAPGTAKSSAGWKIKKLTYSGDNVVDVQWADGVTTYTKVWDDRATYTYS